MTLPATPWRNDYTGNGAVDTYAYGFKIFDDDDLQVTVRDTSDVETPLTKTTHYTVSNVGEAAGGDVALVNGAFDWLDGDGDLKTDYQLTILRAPALLQATSIANYSSYLPSTTEDALDYLAMCIQYLQDQLQRCPKLQVTTPQGDVDTALPTLAAGDGFKLNATEDGFDAVAL